MNILFTSAGRRVELLRAFRQAYLKLNLKGNIVATDIDPLAPALQIASKPYIVPRINSPDYVPAIAEICRSESIQLVFPLIDPDIVVLSQQAKMIEATGARLVLVPPDAVQIAADKWQTIRFFESIGLAVPQSWLPDRIDPAQIEYPLFIKPRGGSASQHTYKICNERELIFFAEYIPDPIIQEYLPGPEFTSDVMCDLSGEVLAVVTRRRLAVRSGEVARGVTVYDPAITEACVKIAHALNAIGPINVQCLMKNDLPHFTEVNTRFGGGLPISIAAGADYPYWLLAREAGIPVEIPPLGSYERELYMTRFDDSFFLTASEYEQIAQRRSEM